MTTVTRPKVRSDAELYRDILKELRWDTHVKQTDVGVEVNQGVVTLTGRVNNYAQKLAAQEAAHRVLGVLDVANDLQVKLPGDTTPTDTEIAQAVRKALEGDALVPHEHIHSTITDGWVTLEGYVPLWSHRQYAENVVCHLTGVRGVTNRIAVLPVKVDPKEIREAIEEALERQAEREAERIEVVVHDGTLMLRGKVRSWMEKKAILGAAGHALGVQAVEDHLQVDPYG
jgi:osmotically-inducible protein OsmY